MIIMWETNESNSGNKFQRIVSLRILDCVNLDKCVIVENRTKDKEHGKDKI
jgi:hypothetical protein